MSGERGAAGVGGDAGISEGGRVGRSQVLVGSLDIVAQRQLVAQSGTHQPLSPEAVSVKLLLFDCTRCGRICGPRDIISVRACADLFSFTWQQWTIWGLGNR